MTRRATPFVAEMLEEHLAGRYGPGAAELRVRAPGDGYSPVSIKPRLRRDGARPTLAVIVPFRDQVEVTLRALASLEEQDCQLDVRVVLVDNGSARPETAARLAGWLAAPRRHTYRLVHDGGAFNYARINNEAVRSHAHDRDLLLFLNNDVELASPDCLETMAAHLLQEPVCGFVGIRLHYPGAAMVQHGGVVVSNAFSGSGYWIVDHARDPCEWVYDEHVVMAVTFACAMTRRRTFEALGGLDERLLPNAFGDVDINLRALRAGYTNHYFGTLVGVHHEGLSRGGGCEDADVAALHERHGAPLAHWRVRQLGFDLASPRQSAPIPLC